MDLVYLGLYTRALWVRQERRHLFVTIWIKPRAALYKCHRADHFYEKITEERLFCFVSK
jgi:hypothetical protein